MSQREEAPQVLQERRKQMLKLVARSFYNELVNYGVNKAEVLSVAGHLLDNVIHKGSPKENGTESQSRLFTVSDVRDEWAAARRVGVHDVTISPLSQASVPQIAAWLQASAIREGFYPRFPDSAAELARYFQAADREYFAISHLRELVGIIGADHIDAESGKLEMRKLVGDPRMHGKGIGKRATFLFLYYAFVLRKFEKVYVHSMDTNIRNLNLNARFGFELEGVFLQDIAFQNERRDVVRMALLRPVWLQLFSRTQMATPQGDGSPP